MGKLKSWLMDQEEQYMEQFDYDSCLFEYQQQMHEEQLEEQLIREGRKSYQMSNVEEQSYQLYMEDKLCGELQNTVHIGSDMNLKDGQIRVGLRRKRGTRK